MSLKAEMSLPLRANDRPRTNRTNSGPARTRPRWDGQARELAWKGRLIKWLRHIACNQTAVLDAFEAAGWPRNIDNPLPRMTQRNAKKCRIETIKSLKLGLVSETIRFRADGTGGGICWEPVA
jgi:hypothetical protein